MGKLEKEAKARRRSGQIQEAVLAVIGVSGLLLASMAAPNAAGLLGKIVYNKYRFNNQSKNALTRLATKGYVTFNERNGKRFARITEKGRAALRLQTMKLTDASPQRWDKRWRVVIFDISEKKRPVRDALRRHMQLAGFMRLQDSAWIYPHDCEEVIALLKAELELGNAVIYMIVEKVENDARIKNFFGLK